MEEKQAEAVELEKIAIVSAMHMPPFINYATLPTVAETDCTVDFIVQTMYKT